ncbi:hypothetical protein QJS10_CPB15g01716 [Acorus calamus]|uniref:EDS1 EP domain-containing protein n=1 Tax=Acorus calamus TaxID=4465 RepID=A0AAV9D999_ACOCL|nr:hypothetical protein QJS10_CPB15g01716 [Acorus calamus]
MVARTTLPEHTFLRDFWFTLVGDSIFGHAIRRENWSRCFLHFVTKHDLVPRVLLAPLPSIKENFHTMLHLLFQRATIMGYPSIEITQLVSSFYITVLRNTSSVASHDACLYMECTNMLLEALNAFIKFSPFRPFGSYAFLAGNGRVLSVKNANAILQLLFYSLQLSSGEEVSNVAFKSVVEHMSYESEVQAILEFIHLDHLEDVYGNRREMTSASMVLDDLGLSTEARLRLSAVGEWEKKKQNNQSKIDGDYKNIEEMLNYLKKYREACRMHEVGYYDAFKLQKNEVDFKANIKRAELAGHWDEIKEMLRRNELPEDFEARPNWVNLGNTYRCLVEPLDIANYYNRAKNDDSGPYMIKGRPQRYKYMQKWFEHSQRKKQQIQDPRRSSLQSCFWAFVEELCIKTSESNHFEEVREIVLELENEAVMNSEFCRDVLLKDSTFVKWWNTLPEQHRLSSCIAPLMK